MYSNKGQEKHYRQRSGIYRFKMRIILSAKHAKQAARNGYKAYNTNKAVVTGYTIGVKGVSNKQA